MARILCNVAGGGKPLKGNAETGDVLAGKTFSNKQSNALTGIMPNRGLHQSSTGVGGDSGSLWAYMPYGYYGNYNNSGNAWIDITDDQAKTLANNAGVGYNKGVSDADNRVNTSSASYNSGYTNGQSAKAVGGMGAVYGFSGSGVEFSKTLPPGTYAWGVSMHSQYWCKYKVSHGGTVVGSNMNGAEKITDTGTFSISSNENCSIWLQAYGGGDTEIAGGYIVRIS